MLSLVSLFVVTDSLIARQSSEQLQGTGIRRYLSEPRAGHAAGPPEGRDQEPESRPEPGPLAGRMPTLRSIPRALQAHLLYTLDSRPKHSPLNPSPTYAQTNPANTCPVPNALGERVHGGVWGFSSAWHPHPPFWQQHLDSPLEIHSRASRGSHSSSDPRGGPEMQVWPIETLRPHGRGVLPKPGHSGACGTGK